MGFFRPVQLYWGFPNDQGCMKVALPTMVTDIHECICLVLLVGDGCLREPRASSGGLQMHKAYLAVRLCSCWLPAERSLLVAAPCR